MARFWGIGPLDRAYTLRTWFANSRRSRTVPTVLQCLQAFLQRLLIATSSSFQSRAWSSQTLGGLEAFRGSYGVNLHSQYMFVEANLTSSITQLITDYPIV